MHMHDSIKTELWPTLEPTLKGRYEGPCIFVAIMRKHQTAGPAAVRQLVHELKSKSIKQVPDENVSELCTTIYCICQQIHGMVCQNEVPKDLPELCAACFLETKTLLFNIYLTHIHKEAREQKLRWDKVVTKLNNEYLTLAKGTHPRWEALKDKKEDQEIKAIKADIKSSKEEIKTLKGELQRRNGGGGGTNTDANKKNGKKTDNNNNKEGGNKHSKLTCRKCKEKGHIAKNCPKKGEGEDKKSEGGGDDKNKWTSPYHIPPKDGKPQVKKWNDVKCAWCD